MDFNDTQDEAEFRAKARAFLDANAERRKPGEVAGYRRGQDAPNAIAEARDYQSKKYEAGLAGISWPKEWGGQGGTQIQQVIFNQEETQYKTHAGIFTIGLGMCLPTICTWGFLPTNRLLKYACPAASRARTDRRRCSRSPNAARATTRR